AVVELELGIPKIEADIAGFKERHDPPNGWGFGRNNVGVLEGTVGRVPVVGTSPLWGNTNPNNNKPHLTSTYKSDQQKPHANSTSPLVPVSALNTGSAPTSGHLGPRTDHGGSRDRCSMAAGGRPSRLPGRPVLGGLRDDDVEA